MSKGHDTTSVANGHLVLMILNIIPLLSVFDTVTHCSLQIEIFL